MCPIWIPLLIPHLMMASLVTMATVAHLPCGRECDDERYDPDWRRRIQVWWRHIVWWQSNSDQHEHYREHRRYHRWWHTAGASTAVGSHGDGGGIFAGGSDLTILDSTISSNSSVGQGGGGIALVGNTALIEDSQIVGNQAISTGPNLGGGISIGGGDLTIRRSNISGNTVSNSFPNPDPSYFAAGGGIAAKSLTPSLSVTVVESTVSGNVASLGGGIASFHSTYGAPNLLIVDSTLSENSAIYGGGVYSHSSTSNVSTILRNSTVTGNSDAGAVLNDTRALIEYSTITDNQSGVIALGLSGFYTEVASSIIAGNHNEDVSGQIQSNGYNLIGTGMTGPFNNNDLINVLDPLLGPLQDNGGLTETHIPLPGSLAIDAGRPTAMAGVGQVPASDQRGMPFGRVEDGDGDAQARIDIGAIEREPTPTVDGDFNDDGVYDCLDINALTTAVATGGSVLLYDLNGDNVLSLADVDAWRAEAGEVNLGPGRVYLVGDANLDSVVDGTDFGRWNAAKFTNNMNWCDGNFNADLVVDGSDFGQWNAHKFTGADATVLVNPGVPATGQVAGAPRTACQRV